MFPLNKHLLEKIEKTTTEEKFISVPLLVTAFIVIPAGRGLQRQRGNLNFQTQFHSMGQLLYVGKFKFLKI